MKPRFPAGLIVVNRPGAAGAVAVAEMARAQPDGYTIVLTPHSALVIAAQINDLAYKTPDDYDPFINLVAYYPLIAVRSESKYKTIQELLGDAKDHPGMIRVGSPGEGTSSHLNLEELMFRAGVKMVHVPYAGWGQSSPRHLHDAAKAAIEDPKFKQMMNSRGIDVDYRPGEMLRADLWREYKLHTPILRRIGLLKR